MKLAGSSPRSISWTRAPPKAWACSSCDWRGQEGSIVNDYEKDVFNGDIGYVTGLDLDAYEIVMDFDARPGVKAFGQLDEFMLPYAVSIHKSQASEYPAVV